MSLLSISVVIPNYNGRKLMEENLPSVFAALKKGNTDFEVIVSDDASTDDSIEFLQKKYPSIIIVRNEVNKGFSPTINLGIFKASKELVFALNNDVKLTDNYFLHQFHYFQNRDTFGVMGRIIGLNDDEIQDAAKYPAVSFYKIKSTVNYLPVSAEKDYWTPTFFLSGANALMDRKKLVELGGFDEVYKPFYLEDVDLSIRAWRLGWKCFYDHSSICRHPSSATIKTYHKAQRVKAISLKNRLTMHHIHFDGIRRLVWILGTIIEFMFSWITLKHYFYKGFFWYLTNLNGANESRRKFKALLKKHTGSKSIDQVMHHIQEEVNKNEIQKL